MQLSLCIGSSVFSLLAGIIPTLQILSSISLKLSRHRHHPRIQIHEYRSLQINVKIFWKCWPPTRVSRLLEHFIHSLSWQSTITYGSSELLVKNYPWCWKGRQCFTSPPQLATFSYQDKKWYKFFSSCVKITSWFVTTTCAVRTQDTIRQRKFINRNGPSTKDFETYGRRVDEGRFYRFLQG